MTRKCPNCRSLNVRRSSARDERGIVQRPFLSPYRCRDCGERFWVIGQRIYRRVGTTVGILTAIASVGVVLAGIMVLLAD